MTRLLTGNIGLLSSRRYGVGGVLVSGVVGVRGRMTVFRFEVKLGPEIGTCCSPMVTASTDSCEPGNSVPDVRGAGVGGGIESTKS